MTAETLSPGGKQARRLLRLYHLYRLSIGITLVLLISSDMDSQLLELANGELFRAGSWLYLILNILAVVLLDNPKGPLKSSAWHWLMSCCFQACFMPLAERRALLATC